MPGGKTKSLIDNIANTESADRSSKAGSKKPISELVYSAITREHTSSAYAIKAPIQPDKKIIIRLVVVMTAFFVTLCVLYGTSKKEIWASEITPIDDFSYYIEDGAIYLTNYIGSSKNVRIGSEYKVGDITYPLGDHLHKLFALNTINSVIIPEGVTSLEDNLFSNSNVKYVYLPQSLQPINSDNPFYSHFHNVKKIYYGGSKEEWEALTNSTNQDQIEVDNIVYNSSTSDLI